MCTLCDDTGWKPVEMNGTRRVERCDCWREAQTAKLLAEAGIPPRYRGCDLDTFRDYNDSLVNAVNMAKALVESFPVTDKGLLFLGRPGIGKTHLAVSILKRLIKTKGIESRFYDTRVLLSLIRNTYNPVVKATEVSVIRPVMDAQLLVLDDLGAERPTEWVEETMNLIINTRYNMRRLTIFTTNYPETAAKNSPVETLVERIGARIFSRLFEMCDFVEMQGVHFRELPDGASDFDIAALDRDGSRLDKDIGISDKRKGPMAKASLRTQAERPTRELGWTGGQAGSHREKPKLP